MFELLEAPPEVIAPEDLVEELESLFAYRDRMEARIADLLHQTWDSEAFERDGYSSVTSMPGSIGCHCIPEAQRLVARANGLAKAPLVAFAHARGAVSGAQVDVLLEARAVSGEAFADAESRLVELALDTPLIRDLRKQLDYWLDEWQPTISTPTAT